MHRFNGVVVITLASHARGPGFDPRLNLSKDFCKGFVSCLNIAVPKYHQQI